MSSSTSISLTSAANTWRWRYTKLCITLVTERINELINYLMCYDVSCSSSSLKFETIVFLTFPVLLFSSVLFSFCLFSRLILSSLALVSLVPFYFALSPIFLSYSGFFCFISYGPPLSRLFWSAQLSSRLLSFALFCLVLSCVVPPYFVLSALDHSFFLFSSPLSPLCSSALFFFLFVHFVSLSLFAARL